jgi:hypothetical protein
MNNPKTALKTNPSYHPETGNDFCDNESLALIFKALSHPVKILKAAGLVLGEIEGPRTCYCLDKKRLELFKQEVANI